MARTDRECQNLRRLGELRERLHHFRVLDPACGSGNFLYVAYRELKRLEARIIERIDTEFPSKAEPGQIAMSYLSAQNFYGMDINPFAVELAKVTMMIARKLAIDELHISERALPLDNLDKNFLAVDALVQSDTAVPAVPDAHRRDACATFHRTPWPKADVIIGNPPFIGAKLLKPQLGPDTVNRLRKLYPEVPGMADFCVYWVRRAHDHLPPCTAADPVAGRAGLVGTQNIRNNASRIGGLDHVVKDGTILEAVDNQPWSGEANVHVSIANWIKTQDPALLPKTRRLWFKVEPTAATKKLWKKQGKQVAKEYDLGFRDVAQINSALSSKTDVSGALPLTVNKGACYTGQYARHDGYLVNDGDARAMLQKAQNNRDVLWPFLVGGEMLTDGHDTRWIIDFQTRSILESKAYGEPFARLEDTVLPYVSTKAHDEFAKTGQDSGQDQNWLKTWWQLFRPRPELIEKISKTPRYIACSRHAKRPIFVFLSPEIRPGDALSLFTFSDDYSFSILQSAAHWQWFIEKGSKIKSDFRYTPESVFDTFPWPQSPEAKAVAAVAAAGREVRRIRAETLPQLKGGLRALYRTLELPGANPLKDAHAALDAAVLAAYGFSARRDLLAQLLTLNQSVAARIASDEAVTAPGIPATYPKPETLITADCIRPA